MRTASCRSASFRSPAPPSLSRDSRRSLIGLLHHNRRSHAINRRRQSQFPSRHFANNTNEEALWLRKYYLRRGLINADSPIRSRRYRAAATQTARVGVDDYRSASRPTTAQLATTACIRINIACALGVTPANRGDLVKLRRSGSANEIASAAVATNRKIFCGRAIIEAITTNAIDARTTPPTHPDSIGSAVKGGKSPGTPAIRTPARAIA